METFPAVGLVFPEGKVFFPPCGRLKLKNMIDLLYNEVGDISCSFEVMVLEGGSRAATAVQARG